MTALPPAWRLQLGAYHHGNDGRGLWYTPYTPSPDGTPISLRTTEYGNRRAGVVSSLTAQLEHRLGEMRALDGEFRR